MSFFEVKDVCKTFPGVKALDHVDFSMEKGEVHALCGANGAGKSTLIKIISGVYAPDSGEMFLDGEPVAFRNPSMAFAAGVGTIFQDFEQAQNLTVAENIALGKLPKHGGMVDWKAVRENASKILAQLHIDIDPDAMVGDLGVGEQQMIEIARVISQNVRLLIMDEPTSSLSSEDVETLFHLIRTLTERGICILYVSHRMEEIFRISDRITVFRDGKKQLSRSAQEMTLKDVVQAMIGDQNHQVKHEESHKQEEVLLSVKNLKSSLMAKPVSFEVHKQEILGLAGLMGAGRTELLCTLFGLGTDMEGEVLLDGKPYLPKRSRDAMNNGVAMVPEDRHNAGVFSNLSIMENIVISCLATVHAYGSINKIKERALARKSIRDFNVKAVDENVLVSTLSGGNQQKVVFAKWLATGKKLLLLDEPTRGIDVGAKAEIYSLTSELVSQGLTVILVSSELKELLDICDRILVLNNGEFVEEIERQNFDYNHITETMMNV